MALTSGEIILLDGQTTYRDLLTFHTKSFKGARIEYTVKRGDEVEAGDIYLSYDRFSATAKIVSIAHFDDPGVRFCASVDGDYVRLLYKSTATGILPIFKHRITNFPQ